jgi:hypothetical protein
MDEGPQWRTNQTTKRQWVMVRTESFKKWFGDWEAVQRASAIENIGTVRIQPTAPIDKETAMTHIKGFEKLVNDEEKREVRFPNSTIGKIFGHQKYKVATIFDDIPRLFKASKFRWTENEIPKENHKSHPDVVYYQYVNKFNDRTGDYFIRFTVTEWLGRRGKEDVNLLHSTAISDVEIYKNDESDSRSRNDRAETGQSSFTDTRLRDFFDSVKNASKVVDENGEPLVVYHGTNKYGFSVFDTNPQNEKMSLIMPFWKTMVHCFSQNKLTVRL